MAAQPAALAIAVSFTELVTRHLAFRSFDYSHDFDALLDEEEFAAQVLAARCRKCFHLSMPWDFYLIFFVLGVVLPWRGQHRLKKLLELPRVEARERIVLYFSTIMFQWSMAGIAAWRAYARGLSLDVLGLGHEGWTRLILAAAIGGGVLGTLHWLNLRRMGGADAKRIGKLRAIGERILPQSRVELPPYIALALTAGLCEEFLYRGFAMGALFRAGLPEWVVIAISSVLFGMAHLYQGRSGFLGTLILGVIFGIARIAYNSIVPVLAWHAVIDLVAGLAGPKYLLRGKSVEKEPEAENVGSLS